MVWASTDGTATGKNRYPALPWAYVALWVVALGLIPDPRPLAAPAVAVKAVRAVTGKSEPVSRAVASVALRGAAFGLLGVLASWAVTGVSVRAAIPLALAVAAGLAVVAQWVNYRHFPAMGQLAVSVPSAVAGVLIGFAARRSRVALAALIVLIVGLYVWGTSTRVSDDVEAVALSMVPHILARSDEIRSGDDGFVDAVRVAFSEAEDNSHGSDAIVVNKAAILALGIILGEEKVARVAKADADPAWRGAIDAVRQRITLRGRGDSPRHFWVSAALVVITDEGRAIAVGVGKELMDSTPGGSGFSFADLAANRAGIQFALAATKDAASAWATQARVLGGLAATDYCPDLTDLPEGLTRDQFQTEYGGLAGAKTRDLMATIEQRTSGLAALRDGR
jgi:hypothetical protein